MSIINKDLYKYMKQFQKEFGDIVPLKELPANTSSEKIISAIKICLDKKENLLTEILSYKEFEKDKSIFI